MPSGSPSFLKKCGEVLQVPELEWHQVHKTMLQTTDIILNNVGV